MSNEQTFFQEIWLSDDRFNGWLEPVAQNNSQARCTRCKKTFGLFNMGVQAVKSHSEGKKHKAVCEMVSCFFKMPKHKSKPASTTNDNPSASPSPSTPAKKHYLKWTNFREVKKVVFRDDLFSRISHFENFREDLFSRLGHF